VRACGASDALLLCCAFDAVLSSGLHSLSAFVLRRNFFARVVCTPSLERSSVCFIFRVVWFAVCFFGWSVSLQSLRRVSVA
jgi:AraC-like DNA-binding protein